MAISEAADTRMDGKKVRAVLDDPTSGRAVTQYSMEFMMTFFTIARSIVGNDFDAAIVLLMIQIYVGERAFRLNERNVRSMSFAESYPDDLLVPISRLAIATLTGMPRETVRRKVEKLEKMGIVRKVGTRGLAISHEFAASAERANAADVNLTAVKKFFDKFAALES